MKLFIAAALLILSQVSWAAINVPEPSNPGVYWVPVDQQLSQFALFDVSDVVVEHTGDRVKVQYDLPLELTGVLNTVSFEGPRGTSGPVVLNGTFGRMECTAPDNFSNCAISYYGLTFDEQAISSVLKSISKTDDELQKRQMVATRFRFGGEPHGFLRVLPKP